MESPALKLSRKSLRESLERFQSQVDPGYIKGYLPGVRENGGQYTHAAIWTVMAFAKLGDAAKAWELFSLFNPIHHGSTPSQIAK